MKYVVAGNAAADCITFADGTSTGFLPGGATLFALTGIQLWTDEVLLCGGFGEDYMDHMGDYLIRNHINRSGFHVRDPKNPLNYMYYRDEGNWDSKAVYGNEHYDMLSCDPEKDHLRDFLSDTVGLTTFRGEDPDFFQKIFALKDEFGFKFCWEIKADFAVPEKMAQVREILEHVDAFSINGPEARTLFQAEDDQAAIAAMQALNLPLVIFRVGKRGIYIFMDGKVLFAPSFQKYPVVDVTGCGNSSTAAAFYAWCEGLDICDVAAYANVTAGHNLRYRGAMELTPENRQAAQEEERELAQSLRDTTL